MLLIVVIPFMELALPIILKIFPNVLPKPFQDKLEMERTLRAEIQQRIRIAEMMQQSSEILDTASSQSKATVSQRTNDAGGGGGAAVEVKTGTAHPVSPTGDSMSKARMVVEWENRLASMRRTNEKHQ
uniref:LETM1 and EF-hand domain-containing protein 1, mitochondrial n=1 Tax=Lygus hesperus TaxID=30085 RepID=A0A0A9XAR7_LYGHE